MNKDENKKFNGQGLKNCQENLHIDEEEFMSERTEKQTPTDDLTRLCNNDPAVFTKSMPDSPRKPTTNTVRQFKEGTYINLGKPAVTISKQYKTNSN